MELIVNNVFETNILNLTVVISIVVNVIGNAAKGFLRDREKNIMDQFTDTDAKQNIANKRLKNAQFALTTAKQFAEKLPMEYREIVCYEKLKNDQQLEGEFQRMKTKCILTAQREKQNKAKELRCFVIDKAMMKVELMIKNFCEKLPPDRDRLNLSKCLEAK